MRGICLDGVVFDEFADFSPRCMVGDRTIDLSLGLIGATVVDSSTIPLSLNLLSLNRRVFISRSMILVVLISAERTVQMLSLSNKLSGAANEVT
jgi:hypothetical protein